MKAMPVACSMALRMAGAGPSMGSSPMPLAPPGPWVAGGFFEVDVDGWEVGAGGHDVVGHLVVGEVAVLPDALFVEGVADALRDAAFDLAGGEDGVEDAADFLEGVEVGDGGGVGGGVDGDFGDVDGPGVGGVGVAAVGVVVPEDVAGGFVADADFEVAELFGVADGGLVEVFGGVGCGERGFGAEFFEELEWRRARLVCRRSWRCGWLRWGRSWGRCGVGLGDEDFFVGEGEGFGGYLAEDGVGALAELGGGDEEAGAAFGGDVDGDFGGEAALAGAGEACSVEEGGEAYASLDGAGGVFVCRIGRAWRGSWIL